jgi:NAD+ synthase (glutamine-hydrolysing)
MNATVGDIAGNASLIRDGVAAASVEGADLVLFPELALSGYPPEDLLLRDHFLADVEGALSELAATVDGLVAIVGCPVRGAGVRNGAAILADGAVQAIYHKVHLPNYGVFDERRYFEQGSAPGLLELDGARIGLSVCEDIWLPGPPVSDEASAGASLIVNISASPYHRNQGAEREAMLAERARDGRVYVAFCALVGGQDELVFDGHSCILDPTGATIARASQFAEDMLVCDVELGVAERADGAGVKVPVLAALGGAPNRSSKPVAARLHTPLEPEAEVYEALVMGTRDYVHKNGFQAVVLGLSGGIDSALVACVATDALGAERVNVGVMPSPFSSAETQGDARALAQRLGVGVHELPIERPMSAYEQTLAGDFQGRGPDITEENLQARIRGNLLMALSNKFGWLVLTTGNKSEMSVGYTTLYGDLAGGFAVIKDVPKTLVYALVRWRNSPTGAAGRAVGEPIPATIITRAPSAELRCGQRDEDSLPPYELLDRILECYVEAGEGREQMLERGLPAAEVDRTIALVDLAEYKRRQAPPGIKVSVRAFGRDRRMPITNRYRGHA